MPNVLDPTGRPIGSVYHEATQAEIDAGVTPTDYRYRPGHILRYIPVAEHAAIIANTSSYDASDDAQEWLDALTPGMSATIVGTVRAQGLVLTTTDITFEGDGWLKPVSNASTDHVLKFGDDAVPTRVWRVRGQLHIGDTGGQPWTWSNVTGLLLENATECEFSIDGRGMGTLLALNCGASSFVAYNVITLGQMIQNATAVQIAPAGASNQNLFLGGRFGMNSGTYATALDTHGIDLIYVDIRDDGAHIPNANVFIGASFENAARYITNEGTNNRFLSCRCEFQVSGTAGVDYPEVFIDNSGGRNNYDFSYTSSWLAAGQAHVIDHGAATQVDDLRFDIEDEDLTDYFFPGQVCAVTVGGTVFTAQVLQSVMSGDDTRVTVSTPIVTANPTAVHTCRVKDTGTLTNWDVPTTEIPSVSSMRHSSVRNTLINWVLCSLSLKGLDGTYPALSLHPGSSASDDLLRTHDFSGNTTSSLTALGQLDLARVRLISSNGSFQSALVMSGTSVLRVGSSLLRHDLMGTSYVFDTTPPEHADDAAAASGGVIVGGIYRTGSVLKIRVS